MNFTSFSQAAQDALDLLLPVSSYFCFSKIRALIENATVGIGSGIGAVILLQMVVVICCFMLLCHEGEAKEDGEQPVKDFYHPEFVQGARKVSATLGRKKNPLVKPPPRGPESNEFRQLAPPQADYDIEF